MVIQKKKSCTLDFLSDGSSSRNSSAIINTTNMTKFGTTRIEKVVILATGFYITFEVILCRLMIFLPGDQGNRSNLDSLF